MADGSRRLDELRRRFDTKGMFDLVRAFPSHMVDAWERGNRFAGSIETRAVGQVVVCGMGGSAIGGDMVRSFLGDGLSVPLQVNRHYGVPASLRRDAFFVFSSYSGNTGETLAAYDAVRGQGIPSAAITSGGELERRCRTDGVPVCSIPGGMPPRAAIAYSFFPLLLTLGALGLAKADEAEFGEAAEALRRWCEEYASDSPENDAARLAGQLEGKLPFVYSCGGLFDAVARRWSCQFNENAKSLAHFGTFTELNHNEIVGWKALEGVRGRIVVISLEDQEDHPMARKQADIALGIVEPLSGGVVRVPGVAGRRMTRILTAMILGDFTSVYLACLNGVDPTPVSNIDFLKERLRKSSG
jgi:glucose/mannose-6-phosphate isomerase